MPGCSTDEGKNMLKKRGRYIYWVVLLLVSVAAFSVRWRGMEYVSGDFGICVLPWSEAMKTGQGLSILSTYDGDYNMPYITVLWLLNYLPGRTIVKVKMFSVLFDYLGALAAGFITAHFAKSEKKALCFILAYIVLLFHPSVILNSAYWGQCDSVYVTFLLYMIWAILKRRYNVAMIFFGCALSFKLQAVLILPILLIFWWKKRFFSCIVFFFIPIVMEILCIPAILGGYSVFAPFLIYKRQLGRYPNMYVFYPNFWALFKDAHYYIFSSAAIIFVLVGLGILALAVIRKQDKITEKQWIEFAVWSTFFMICFLPSMHERYGMLAEILVAIYAFLEKKAGGIAAVIGIGSFITYLQTGLGYSLMPDQWIAVANLLCLSFLSWQMVKNWHGREKDEVYTKYSEKQKRGMSVIENRWMDIIDRYILWMAVVIFTVLAVAARKPMIEYMSPDYLPNLIEVEGNHHTPLYMLIMYILSNISNSILEGKTLFFLVKMLCIGSDIFAAGMTAVCFYDFETRRDTGRLERSEKYVKCDRSLRAVILYGVMLFFPAVLFNSVLWGHLDSISVGLLMGAYLLYVREKRISAGILAGLSCGLLIYYAVWLAVAGLAVKIIVGKKGRMDNGKKRSKYAVNSFIIVLFLCGLSGILCEYSFGQSIFKFLDSWKNVGGWVIYPVLVFALFACFCDQRWIPIWMLLELAVALDWGEFLYNQPILPYTVYFALYLLAGIWSVLIIWKGMKEIKTEKGY